MSGAAMMVWPRPPTRSRASKAITDRPESFSACGGAKARGARADDGDVD